MPYLTSMIAEHYSASILMHQISHQDTANHEVVCLLGLLPFQSCTNSTVFRFLELIEPGTLSKQLFTDGLLQISFFPLVHRCAAYRCKP